MCFLICFHNPLFSLFFRENERNFIAFLVFCVCTNLNNFIARFLSSVFFSLCCFKLIEDFSTEHFLLILFSFIAVFFFEKTSQRDYEGGIRRRCGGKRDDCVFLNFCFFLSLIFLDQFFIIAGDEFVEINRNLISLVGGIRQGLISVSSCFIVSRTYLKLFHSALLIYERKSK